MKEVDAHAEKREACLRLGTQEGWSQNSYHHLPNAWGTGATFRKEEPSALFAGGDAKARGKRTQRWRVEPETGHPAHIPCPPKPSGPRCPHHHSQLHSELS